MFKLPPRRTFPTEESLEAEEASRAHLWAAHNAEEARLAELARVEAERQAEVDRQRFEKERAEQNRLARIARAEEAKGREEEEERVREVMERRVIDPEVRRVGYLAARLGTDQRNLYAMLLDDDEFGEPMDVDLPPLPQSLIQLRVPRLKPEPVSDDEELLVVDVKKFQGQPLQTPMNAFGFDEMAGGAARSLVNPSVMTVETVKRERVVESIESSQSFGLDSTEDSDDEDVDPNRGRRQSRGGMRMLGHQGQYIY